MIMDLQELLRFAIEHNASDVHVQAGVSPMLRIAGQMRAVDAPPLTDEQARDFVRSIVPSHR